MTMRLISALALLAVGCHSDPAPPLTAKHATPSHPAPACELAPKGTGKAEDPELNARVSAGQPQALVRVGEALVRRARSRSEPSLYRRVETCARTALRAAPTHEGALALLALVQLDAHDFVGAERTARKLLSGSPDNARAFGLLSDAQLEQGKLSAAIESAQKAVDLKPDLPSYARAAHLRFLQGDAAGAKQIYAAAIRVGLRAVDPEPLAWVTVEAARVFLAEGDLQGAEAGFDQALAYVPSYSPALAGKRQIHARRHGHSHVQGSGHGHEH